MQPFTFDSGLWDLNHCAGGSRCQTNESTNESEAKSSFFQQQHQQSSCGYDDEESQDISTVLEKLFPTFPTCQKHQCHNPDDDINSENVRRYTVKDLKNGKGTFIGKDIQGIMWPITECNRNMRASYRKQRMKQYRTTSIDELIPYASCNMPLCECSSKVRFFLHF